MSITKGQVNKAGDMLRQNQNNEVALDLLSAWRSMHAYPLKLAFDLLKRHTDKIGNHALYGQRLKRVHSIIYKLRRLPDSKLSRIQDIGGCRVILTNYDRVRELYQDLKRGRSILKNHKDYITYPKNDGYRSIHLIYQCKSKISEFNDLKIEFQLRTKLQHAWATAVEIVDSFEGQNLKLGGGDVEWRRFFYLVADEFAKLECLPLHDNSITIDRISEIRKLTQSLQVIDKLRSYPILIKQISNANEMADYYIVRLDIPQKSIFVAQTHDIEIAQNIYIELEKQHLNDNDVNVVLVRGSSIKNLKKAYPNYFGDAEIFLTNLNKILS